MHQSKTKHSIIWLTVVLYTVLVSIKQIFICQMYLYREISWKAPVWWCGAECDTGCLRMRDEMYTDPGLRRSRLQYKEQQVLLT